MLKKSLLIFIIVLCLIALIGCDSGRSSVSLAPPAWIQGVWAVNPEPGIQFTSFQFTMDDVIAQSVLITSPLSFKIGYVPAKVTENSSLSHYYIKAEYQSGAFVIYDFQQTTVTTFTLNYTTSEGTKTWSFTKQ